SQPGADSDPDRGARLGLRLRVHVQRGGRLSGLPAPQAGGRPRAPPAAHGAGYRLPAQGALWRGRVAPPGRSPGVSGGAPAPERAPGRAFVIRVLGPPPRGPPGAAAAPAVAAAPGASEAGAGLPRAGRPGWSWRR